MENLMIVFGGKSVEHDISIITGVQITNACYGLGYNLLPVYIDRNNAWFYMPNLPKIENFKDIKNKTTFKKVFIMPGDKGLYFKSRLGRIKKQCDIDFALLCNHGRCGEDGALPVLMEMCDIPYSSSNGNSCAIAMDKGYMKDIFVANAVPTLPYQKIENSEDISYKELYKNMSGKLGANLIIKPANLGSSIGINTAKNKKTFEFALKTAFNFDNKVVIEPKLDDFIELNVSVRKDTERKIIYSRCEYPKISNSILSFEDKYMSKEKQGYSKNKFALDLPHLLPKELEKQAQNWAVKIYKIFDAEGIVRIDFLYDKNAEKIYANEINTIPGSLSLNLWLKSGFSNASVIKSLIKNGLKKYQKEKQLIKTFESNVLNIY